MTALNCVLQRDRVTVISDSAFFDGEGFVQGFSPKALAVPHWPAVIGMRGPAYAHALLVSKAALRFASLDAFAKGARPFLSEFVEEHAEMLTGYGLASGMQIVVAGYSPDYGICRAFAVQAGVADDGCEGTGVWGDRVPEMVNLKPVFFPTNSAFVLPRPSAEAMEAHGVDVGEDVGTLDAAGMRAWGMRMLSAQREVTGALSRLAEPWHAVGGRPVFLTVSRDGTITTSTGPAWPDRIGERINPAVTQPPPDAGEAVRAAVA